MTVVERLPKLPVPLSEADPPTGAGRALAERARLVPAGRRREELSCKREPCRRGWVDAALPI
eukprot:COSAG04_NODE_17792_length_459_cov_0.483333_1_plen_62_part_00